MSTAILEMNNKAWHVLSSMGILKKNIKLDNKRGLMFIQCNAKEADTIKGLIDSATIIKA